MNVGMRYFFVLIFALFFCGNYSFAIEEIDEKDLFNAVEIKDGSILSVLDCVSSAFKNSPEIRRRKYNLDIAKSNVGIAKSQYFPVVSVGVGFYNENNSDNIYYNSHYRELPSVGLAINKLIWNFGKTTSYIKMEEFYQIGAEYEFIDSLCSTLFDIKEKYYNLLRAEALLEITKHNIEINEEFLKLANGKKKYDIKNAELNLSDSKLKFIEAQNNYKNEKINLSNSMYLDNQPDFLIKDTLTFSLSNLSEIIDKYKNKNSIEFFEPKVFDFPVDNAVEIAYENSPDLKVLLSTKQAMEQALSYIKKTYLPDLTLDAGYNYNNSNQTGNNSLDVGVNLISSVNVQELRYNIKSAQAQLNLADNEIVQFKKELYFNVKRAFNNVDKAQRQIPTAIMEVEQSLNALDIVKEQYLNDELNYIALQSARQDYIKSLIDYVKSIYDYNIALIELEMALHYHIVDIHHKSEHAIQYHFKELIDNLNAVLGCDEVEKTNSKNNKKKRNNKKNRKIIERI